MKRVKGSTLIELVLAIAIIGIVFYTALSASNHITSQLHENMHKAESINNGFICWQWLSNEIYKYHPPFWSSDKGIRQISDDEFTVQENPLDDFNRLTLKQEKNHILVSSPIGNCIIPNAIKLSKENDPITNNSFLSFHVKTNNNYEKIKIRLLPIARPRQP